MRNIIWYCDMEGGCGKTAFARYILTKMDNILFVSSGSAKDIGYQILKAKNDPQVVIFNLPRSAEGGMSYASLENVKDGLLFSGKYEGGFKLFPPPHVVVFANFLPDYGKLSIDRWVIRHLLANPARLVLQ